MTLRHVLFVCVANSCRSQMAEGFARSFGGGRVAAHSAGSRPSGLVDPRARAFMAGRGIDISQQRSKGLDELPTLEWDLIVTMGCGDACPSLPARCRADWDLADPAPLPDAGFHAVGEEIERRVRGLLGGSATGHDGL